MGCLFMCEEELVNTCQEEEMVNSYMHSECEDHEEGWVMLEGTH